MNELIRRAARRGIPHDPDSTEDDEAQQLLADAIDADDDQGQRDVTAEPEWTMDDLIRRHAGLDTRRHRDRSGRRVPEVGDGID